MDPNQQTPSSSTPVTPEGMISFAQLEQLLRLLQPNANIGQTLAAMVTPPPTAAAPQPDAAQTAAVPPPTEVVAEIVAHTVSPPEPKIQMGDERAEMAVGAERSGVMVDVGGVDVEIIDVREEDEQAGPDVGGAEVAPDSIRTEMASLDAGAGIVRTEMATAEAEMEADAAMVKADIADIREERVPMIELKERGRFWARNGS